MPKHRSNRSRGKQVGPGGAGAARAARDAAELRRFTPDAQSGNMGPPAHVGPVTSSIEGSSVRVTQGARATLPPPGAHRIAPRTPHGSPALTLERYRPRRSLMRPGVLIPAGLGLGGGAFYLHHRQRQNQLKEYARANGSPNSSFASTARSRGRTHLAKSDILPTGVRGVLVPTLQGSRFATANNGKIIRTNRSWTKYNRPVGTSSFPSGWVSKSGGLGGTGQYEGYGLTTSRTSISRPKDIRIGHRITA